MRVCLFDIDGTLIRSGGAGSRAMKCAFEEVFEIACDLNGVSFAGRTDFGITADLFERSGIEHSASNLDRFYAAYLPILSRELSQCDGAICAGVETWLNQLAADPRCSVGLLTGNMRAAAEIKLRHFELWHHFDFGGFGDSAVRRSDAVAQAITAAVDNTGPVVATDIWTIGDTPGDIHAAREHGIRVVAVATGGYSFEELKKHQPDLAVEDLVGVAQLIEQKRLEGHGKIRR